MKKNALKQRIYIVILFSIIMSINGFSQTPCLLKNWTTDVYGHQECSKPLVLVIDEHFNSNSQIGLNWNIDEGVINDPYNTTTWFSANNVNAINNHLIINAVQDFQYRCFDIWVDGNITLCDLTSFTIIPSMQHICHDFNYTSGNIQSKQKFGYGKFEIKCKIPKGPGFWPSFWLFEGNPFWNEIDVFEFNNHNNYKHMMTVHFDLNGNGDTNDPSESCLEEYSSSDFSDSFHTFTLVWDEYKMEWWVDGVLKRLQPKYYYHSYTNGQEVNCEATIDGDLYQRREEANFPNEPMNLIAGFGAQSCNYTPDATTQWPGIMDIEYIKVWQIDNGCCKNDKIYEATDNLPAKTGVIDYIRAGNDAGIPDLNGEVTVKTGQDISFNAGNYIELTPGFTVEAGAGFTAKIEECSPITQTTGDDITGISFPSSFSPDGDGIDDKLFVYVNGATSYTIRVEDKDPPYNSFYYAEKIPITTNPVCV